MGMKNCKKCKHYSMCGFSKYASAEKCLDFWDVSDVVKVVRCKDCKHYLYDDFDGAYVCMQLSKYVKPDFWCAHGERKDNER